MGKKVKKYVIDSSVILNSILESEKTNHNVTDFLRVNLKKSVTIDLVRIEISNCLTLKIDDLEIMNEIYKKFTNLAIETLEVDEFALEFARQIAFDIKDSVYDTLYHAVAILNNLDFVTLDKKYFQKAKKFGHTLLLE